MKQSYNEAQNIISRWENSTPADEEPNYPRCRCGMSARFKIDGTYYCEDCVDMIGNGYLDDVVCEVCGKETDVPYIVRGEAFCWNCFCKEFEI